MLVLRTCSSDVIYLNFSLCFLSHLIWGFVIFLFLPCILSLSPCKLQPSLEEPFSNVFISGLEPAVVPFDLLLSHFRCCPLFTSEMLGTWKTVIVGNRCTSVLSIGFSEVPCVAFSSIFDWRCCLNASEKTRNGKMTSCLMSAHVTWLTQFYIPKGTGLHVGTCGCRSTARPARGSPCTTWSWTPHMGFIVPHLHLWVPRGVKWGMTQMMYSSIAFSPQKPSWICASSWCCDHHRRFPNQRWGRCWVSKPEFLIDSRLRWPRDAGGICHYVVVHAMKCGSALPSPRWRGACQGLTLTAVGQGKVLPFW